MPARSRELSHIRAHNAASARRVSPPIFGGDRRHFRRRRLKRIAHHLAGLPSTPHDWVTLAGRHHYPPTPFLPHHHPHFPSHMFAALENRPLNTSPRIASEPTASSLGPISINCHSGLANTSPNTSPTQVGLLTTAKAPPSPQEDDDISVTASSPVPSPQPPPAFPGVVPPNASLQTNHHHHQHHLLNNALAASLFLNTPLLPPPGQWLYSHLYSPDWPWIHLRNSSSLISGTTNNSSPPVRDPKTGAENSSAGRWGNAADSDGMKEQQSNNNNTISNNNNNNNNHSDEENLRHQRKDEGVNLTVARVRKAAVTLVRQKGDSSTTDKDSVSGKVGSRSSRNSDVWRPY